MTKLKKILQELEGIEVEMRANDAARARALKAVKKAQTVKNELDSKRSALIRDNKREILSGVWPDLWDMDRWKKTNSQGFSYSLQGIELEIKRSSYNADLFVSLNGEEKIELFSTSKYLYSSVNKDLQYLRWELYKKAQLWAHKEGIPAVLVDDEITLMSHQSRVLSLKEYLKQKGLSVKKKVQVKKELDILQARVRAQESILAIQKRQELARIYKDDLLMVPDLVMSYGKFSMDPLTKHYELSVPMAGGYTVYITIKKNAWGGGENMGWKCQDMMGDVLMKGNGIGLDSAGKRELKASKEIKVSIEKALKRLGV